MVKLFVGNLTPEMDPNEIRTLFEQYGQVSECEIIRNFAFVHMDNEQEAEVAFKNLNNYMVAGRPIHVEYSTSKLRTKPGMDDLCFRCAAKDHKTHNCPVHEGPKNDGGRKRPAGNDYPPSKYRTGDDYWGDREVPRYRGGYSGRFSPPMPRPGGGQYGEYYGRSPTTLTGGGAYEDPLIPKPADRLLLPLYEEYLNARERYYYYRDRLERELYAMRRAGSLTPVAPAPPPPSGRVPGTGYGNASYGTSAVASASGNLAGPSLDPYTGRSRSPSSIVRYPELYYARQAAAASSGVGTTGQQVTVYEYGSVGSGNTGLSSTTTGRSLYDPYP